VHDVVTRIELAQVVTVAGDLDRDTPAGELEVDLGELIRFELDRQRRHDVVGGQVGPRPGELDDALERGLVDASDRRRDRFHHVLATVSACVVIHPSVLRRRGLRW
jgi:hypothetical protein